MNTNASITETKHKNSNNYCYNVDTMHKPLLATFLTAIMVLGFSSSSIMRFGVVHAKPTVPDFTVNIVSHPYYESPIYEIDPYTGENVTIQSGYHVENKSIEITIINQPFAPYNDTEGNLVNLFYNVRFKGHFGEEWDWEELYPYKPVRNGISGTYHQNPPQSSSEYTVISFPVEYPDGALVDFQVQKLEGFYTIWSPFPGTNIKTWKFTGELSDFSEIQTLTISSLQTPKSEPFPITIAVTSLAIVAIIGIGILVYFKKIKKK